MKATEFEKYMRGHQFDGLCVPEGMFIALHVDGDNFSRFTKDFEQPYDEDFRDKLLETAKMLHKHFDAITTYVQSDEINLILPREYTAHRRNIVKITNKATSLATAFFNRQFDPHFFEDLPLAHFATHLYLLPKWEQVIDYLNWRKADCEKNALNSTLFWELRSLGMSPKSAASTMNGMGHNQKLGYLEHTLDKDFFDMPYHFRYGHEIFWGSCLKSFVDSDGNEQTVPRRKLVVSSYKMESKGYLDELKEIHSFI